MFSGSVFVQQHSFWGCDKLSSILMPEGATVDFYKSLEMEPLALAYLRYDGEMTGSIKKAMHTYIKRQRKVIAGKLVASGDGGAMARFLAVLGKAPLDELDEYIDMAAKAGQAESAVAILEYKQTQYPPQERAAAEQDAMDKALGLKKRTVADWKKLLRFKDTDGGLVITGNKSRGAVMEIPDMIGKKSVVAIDLKDGLPYDTVERITVPASVTSITGLSLVTAAASIDEAEDNPVFRSVDGVLFSKDGTKLLRCPMGRIGDYEIPQSVTHIGREAFSGCGALTGVTVPAGVEEIGDSAFSGCAGMMNVSIPDSVTRIGYNAFFGCKSLTGLIIPEGVTHIVYGAFRSCPNLTIHAPAGSYAEQYAKENDIPFEAI